MKHYAVDTTLYVVAQDEDDVIDLLYGLQHYMESSDIAFHPNFNSVSAEPRAIRFLYVADEEQA